MSLAQPPPAKRARVDEDAPIRSDVWHSDGSVVLQASNTQFRVHWSVLKMHSPIFNDLHGVPQPAEPGPMVEGCPVVELHDDPGELEHLLRALYNPALFAQENVPFDVLVALVRLGRKYECKELRKASLQRVMRHFPTTLAGYDAFRAEHGDPSRARLNLNLGAAIQLFKEQRVLSALPSAYYMILLYDRLGECDDSECLRLLVRAVARMGNTRFQPGYPFSWALEAPSPQCLTPAECRESQMDAIREVINRVHIVGYLPVSSLARWAAKRFPHCRRCAEDARVSAMAGRAKAWDDLPSMFGLPSWDELKASDEI